jgi:predicted alpha/beta superfamily hydrolase
MKKFTLFYIFSFFATIAFAKHTITLQLVLPKENSTNNYFFASNLNGWNPSSKKYQFVKDTLGFYELRFEVPTIELVSFKITKGAWELVESDEKGKDISNRIIETSKIKKDTTIIIKINRWKDEFANVPRQSTASKNVEIISDNFPLRKLGKTRRIWVYTPSDYLTSTKKYAVMYMHDGQNLFDELTGPFGEWGVDECLDTMTKKLNLDLIIVGIDNGLSDRLSEYSPYDFKVKPDEVNVWDVKGSGTEYLESLVYDLKPYIDSVYRTKKDSRNTSISGSSMGGLISLYAIMRYPDVFGSAGVFSPAFWTNMEALKKEINANSRKDWKGNVYMIAGELEGKKYTDNMEEISELLKRNGKKEIISRKIKNGQHNEIFWRTEFPSLVKWIIAN